MLFSTSFALSIVGLCYVINHTQNGELQVKDLSGCAPYLYFHSTVQRSKQLAMAMVLTSFAGICCLNLFCSTVAHKFQLEL